jgi:nitrogen fixation protein NifU and related proteins
MESEGFGMSDPIDDFVEGLQAQIFEETRAAYGETAFQRWLKPLHAGAIDQADGYGRVTGPCGDTMEIFLQFEEDKVKKASFHTDGCGSSTVCGSFAAELAHGKTPDELLEITGERILEVLGGLPKEDRHCAFLAAESLHEALNDHMTRQAKKGPDESRNPLP